MLILFTTILLISSFVNSTISKPKKLSTSSEISQLNPFGPYVTKLLQWENNENCPDESPFVTIKRNLTDGIVYVILNQDTRMQRVECILEELVQAKEGIDARETFHARKRQLIYKQIPIPPDLQSFSIVCRKNDYKIVYRSTHTIFQNIPMLRERLDYYNQVDEHSGNRPYSILMLSLDGISRLNFIRLLPLTSEYLHSNGWFDLQAYAKVDTIGFSNLFPILTGHNTKSCQSNEFYDGCPFIWHHFNNANYATAFGEGNVSLRTLNRLENRLDEQPLDYYLHPYVNYTNYNYLDEHQSETIKSECLRYKMSFDHIYNYALDFATNFQNYSFFGTFTTNIFQKNIFNIRTDVDETLKRYIVQMKNRNILENTIVMLFSTHGVTYKELQYTPTALIEKHLPFFYMWLPNRFKNEHPEKVRALQINQNRLTSPYDIHVTLLHILKMSGMIRYSLNPSLGGSKSQSIFNELPIHRSCKDAGIPLKWCARNYSDFLNADNFIAEQAITHVLDVLNSELSHIKIDSRKRCAKLNLNRIVSINKRQYDEYVEFGIIFMTMPNNALFHVIVNYYVNNTNHFHVPYPVKRIDSFKDDSPCIRIGL